MSLRAILFLEINMTTLLEMPDGENSLITAYKAITQGRNQPDKDTVKTEYEQHFVSKSDPFTKNSKVFERISLVDPTIITIVGCNTTSF
jgi:hypothetical protein